MNVSKLDIEDYYLEHTLLESGTTTHQKAGRASTDQIGSWTRKRMLGQGSSGVVFLQEHTTSGALRAVKMLNYGSQAATSREIRSMLFLKNYRRLFVDFLAWYFVDVTFIAMEYVPGGDLLAYIRKVGPLEEGEAKGIAEQILQAVYVLHEHELMHCDLKPENIFITGTSPVTIKVADLGQTKQLEGSYNTTSGTRAWAAPEQSTPNYNKSVDLWGVGCVVYFLLTSLTPFLEVNDKSPTAMIEKYKFPVWKRLPRDSFQISIFLRRNGDKIIVRGVSMTANNFLNNLIVRDPAGRISVYAALQHKWICDTTPLESALRRGDLPLSRLLAQRDHRFTHGWPEQLPMDVCFAILRFAAAHGHSQLVSRMVQAIGFHLIDLPPRWWPNTSHPLIGAAEGGHLEIVNDLLNCAIIARSKISGETVLLALEAAVQAGHLEIESLLLPLVTPTMVRTHVFCGLIARHKDRATLITTIEQYKDISTSRSGLVRVDVDCLGYRLFFPTMLTAAMEAGNIDNIHHLLSDPPSRLPSVKLNIFRTAVSTGRRDVVELLVQSYAKVLEITPTVLERELAIAASEGHLNVVECLLSFGALPDRSTIEKAVLEKNKALVKPLIKALIVHGSPPSIETAQEWILRAIPLCDESLLIWLDHTASQPHVSNTSATTSNRAWNICDAANGGDLEVVHYLLQDKQSYSGPTSLQAMALVGAAKAGHIDIVRYLCSVGIDLTAREPWRVCARNGHVKALELLLRHGKPDPGVLNQAMGIAAKAGHLEVVMALLSEGAWSNGLCDPLISSVLAAFTPRARPAIGTPAISRN